MTSDAFPEAEDIAWAPSKDKAIISFPYDSKILYDFTQRKQYSLPKETAEFSFSPNSDKIAFKYKGENRDDRWLAVSNPDGSEAAIIEPLGDKDNFVSVNWSPNDQVIATYQQSADANNSDIIFLGQHDENFKSASVAGRDFRGVWSPTGQKMVYSVYNAESNYSPKLWVMDAMGDNIGEHNTSLEIATWADKCTFSSSNSSNIYCAVPKYLEAGSGLYPELADSVPDDFYMINTTTGAKTLLAVPISSSGYNNFNAQDVYLSANEDYLYFTDKNTGKVIQIRLK
jgi:Tol biopolymer transport system component